MLFFRRLTFKIVTREMIKKVYDYLIIFGMFIKDLIETKYDNLYFIMYFIMNKTVN